MTSPDNLVLMWDLDDTLYSEETYFRAVFSAFLGIRDVSQESLDSFLSDFQFLRSTRRDIFREFLKAVGLESRSNHDLLFELYKTVSVSLMPIPSVAEVFAYALNQGWRAVVVSNGVVEAQENKWRSLALPGKSAARFLSARGLGWEKPSWDLMSFLERANNLDWVNVVAIGNHYGKDLEPALCLGARAVYVNAPDAVKQTDRLLTLTTRSVTDGWQSLFLTWLS